MKACLPLLLLAIGLALVMVSESAAAEPGDAALAKAKSRFARFGTNRVHYVSLGRGGTPLVFVHGWSCRLDFWRYQVPDLAAASRIILVDLPGHGESDKPETNYTMEFFADAVQAVLKDAGVPRAVLAGHSMGVPVVCAFARAHPEATAGLIAVDGSLRAYPFATGQVDRILAPYRSGQHREQATKFVEAMFLTPGSEALKNRARNDVLKTPPHVMLSAFENLFTGANWPPAKIDVPLLVLNAKSPLWSDDYVAHVRRLAPQADYRVIEGAGHFVMLEQPAAVNRALLEFLRHNRFIH